MKRAVSILACLCWLCSLRAAAEDDRSVELESGQQKVFRVSGLTKVSVGASDVIDVRVSGSEQFILYGKKPGRATLVVFRRGRSAVGWQVRVLDDKVGLFLRQCSDLLGPDGCAGFTAARAGDRIALSGRARDLEAYQRLRKLKAAFPDLVLLVEVEPQVLDAVVRAIKEEFASAGIGSVKVSRVGRRILMEGTVADETEKRKAEIIVEAIYDAALGN